MTGQPSESIPLSHPNPRILIIGAGVGGLALANLCEAAGFDYLILERASEFKPLGSAISLNHLVFPFLDQLGIYEDLVKVGRPFHNLTLHTLNVDSGKIKRKGALPSEPQWIEKFGYPGLMFARPDLMEALLKKVPKSKILMQKKVTAVQQNKDGVVVQVADGTTYHGHILVGADGCYSLVRESMYAEIEKHKPLPATDKAPLKYDVECVVGVTEPLDVADFPDLDKEGCEFQVVLPKQQMGSVWYMPLSRNRMGWMINEVIPEEKKARMTIKTDNNDSKQTEWSSSETAEEMCKRFSHHRSPYGKATLQTFIDKTPKELVSKVLLEEKFFETWQDGRTCLIGDACHKVLPFGAVGAINAMLDAVQLANLIYDLKSNSYESIREMLTKYESLRKEYGRAAVEGSSVGATLFHSKGWIADMIRFVILHLVPKNLMLKGADKVAKNRPQCAFLPFKKLGFVKHDRVDYCTRYVMEKEQAEGAKQFDEEILPRIEELTLVGQTVTV